MIGTIPHPLSHAKLLDTPATAPGTTVAAYLQALKSVVIPSGKKTLSADEVNYRVFERWVKQALGPEAVLTVNEELIAQLNRDMSTGLFAARTGRAYTKLQAQAACGIRRLHNAAHGSGCAPVTRILIDNRCIPRYRFFLSLTPTTQAAMAWFEEAGTRPGKAGSANTILTVASRKLGINEAFWLLKKLDVIGLECINPAMLTGLLPTSGPDDPNYRRIVRSINGVSALYRSCAAAGRLPSDPTSGIAHNKFSSYQERDFLPPEELDRARDLSTLDMKDNFAVIDRLALLLYADAALRRGELASLKLSQVTKRTGGYTIHLLSENQKMVARKPIDMHLLYPETNRLLDHYLSHIRPRAARQGAEKLLLDRNGDSASDQTLSDACVRAGRALGLATYYDRTAPSPHDLRRTFGMCNASPLGLNLQPHELSERLRDSIEVVFKHYVTANPLITERRAQVYRKRASGSIDEDRAQELLATLRVWRMPATLVKRLDEEIRRRSPLAAPSPMTDDGYSGIWIDESAAHDLLIQRWGQSPFWKKLRSYMRTQGALRRSARFGKVAFKESVIRLLADDYVPISVLRAQRMVDRRRLAEATSSKHAISFGRLVVLRKAAVGDLLVLDEQRAVEPTSRSTVQTSSVARSKHPLFQRKSTPSTTDSRRIIDCRSE